MYYVMTCMSPTEADHAVIKHKKDHPFRMWHAGTPFRADAAQAYKKPPQTPIVATIEEGDEGVMAEFWDNPVPLMTRKLYERLLGAGIDNLEIYPAEIREDASGKVHSDYVAFNLIGSVAAADLQGSTYTGTEKPSIDGGFTSLKLDELKTKGLLLFRLAEAVNAIVVHEAIKAHIEAGNITTLTFLPPENWGT
jgi:hypothetical protein